MEKKLFSLNNKEEEIVETLFDQEGKQGTNANYTTLHLHVRDGRAANGWKDGQQIPLNYTASV